MGLLLNTHRTCCFTHEKDVYSEMLTKFKELQEKGRGIDFWTLFVWVLHKPAEKMKEKLTKRRWSKVLSQRRKSGPVLENQESVLDENNLSKYSKLSRMKAAALAFNAIGHMHNSQPTHFQVWRNFVKE